MRIGFVVNKIETEEPGFTTTRLSMAAMARGHECFVFSVGDFVYAKDGTLHALARRATGTGKRAKSLEKFLAALQDADTPAVRITIDKLDVLMLRNDPASTRSSGLGPKLLRSCSASWPRDVVCWW